MTLKQKLNLLSKEEIIDVIINRKGPFSFGKDMIIRACEEYAVDKYSKKLDEISDKQCNCNLMTAKGRAEYSRLDKEYSRVNRIFESLCGIEDLVEEIN